MCQNLLLRSYVWTLPKNKTSSICPSSFSNVKYLATFMSKYCFPEASFSGAGFTFFDRPRLFGVDVVDSRGRLGEGAGGGMLFLTSEMAATAVDSAWALAKAFSAFISSFSFNLGTSAKSWLADASDPFLRSALRFSVQIRASAETFSPTSVYILRASYTSTSESSSPSPSSYRIENKSSSTPFFPGNTWMTEPRYIKSPSKSGTSNFLATRCPVTNSRSFSSGVGADNWLVFD
mmetsp:Transcript_4598/g.12903  ORF Transcript_4598/g.12903 Transcript_4598/m.12903 type:complete len:234 (-) Transcript_4598:592-1293(-)